MLEQREESFVPRLVAKSIREWTIDCEEILSETATRLIPIRTSTFIEEEFENLELLG
jgi:hypothetical protein